ncbi:MAG: gliding motility lipoprotein GldD [Flavobacteriales bacterium]|nr:gliding motility lipoprotein GldD [Flavobacteriales bacterium]
MHKLFPAIIFILSLAFTSCDDNTYPRPRGNVRLDYPKAKYSTFVSNHLHASFNKSDLVNVDIKRNDWVNFRYPKMKATIHLTYKDIKGDAEVLIDEVQKLTYKHTVKASGIIENPYGNPENNTYGTLFEVKGNAASNLQFYITDSTKHILSGALYFYVAPNPDSLSPAIDYIKKDIIALIESLEWED